MDSILKSLRALIFIVVFVLPQGDVVAQAEVRVRRELVEQALFSAPALDRLGDVLAQRVPLLLGGGQLQLGHR